MNVAGLTIGTVGIGAGALGYAANVALSSETKSVAAPIAVGTGGVIATTAGLLGMASVRGSNTGGILGSVALAGLGLGAALGTIQGAMAVTRD